MATAMRTAATPVDRVCAAAAAAFWGAGERAIDVPLLEMAQGARPEGLEGVRCIVASDVRVVEIAVDERAVEAVATAVWDLGGAGWDVVVLIPAARCGEAHATLRGAPCTLQPWWTADDAIAFGKPETP